MPLDPAIRTTPLIANIGNTLMHNNKCCTTFPVRCEEPHVENVAPTSDLVVTLATGIVPISHASSSHHDQRWPGQQLPDGMRGLDGREAWEGCRVALPVGFKLFVCNEQA